ncbi:MAG: Gx transporter family protein [Treponema sp.]|nr:Gx transporter family protein [Treponema sp.]
MLGAFCLFLSTVEYLIPKPIPFMRIGIANLPLMLALDLLPLKSFLLLLGIKVIGQGIITGTLFSYILLFSLTGTCVSALSMFALRRFRGPKRLGMAGISVLGALLSNGAQLALARFFIFGQSVRYIVPPFLAMGLVTALVLGLFCEYFIRRSRWYAGDAAPEKEAGGERSGGPPPHTPYSPSSLRFFSPQTRKIFRERRREMYERLFSGEELCLAGLLMMPAVVFNPNTYFRALQFLFFWFLAWLSGKKNNPLITILIILGITAFNLTVPYGQVLFSFGPVRITAGALLGGIQRAVTLEALIMLSRAAIRHDLRLPGSFGKLIGESFRILTCIRERKQGFTRKNLVTAIDNLMIELSETGADAAAETPSAPRRLSTAMGRIILAAAAALAWLPWLFIP